MDRIFIVLLFFFSLLLHFVPLTLAPQAAQILKWSVTVVVSVLISASNAMEKTIALMVLMNTTVQVGGEKTGFWALEIQYD